jgi:hypothetical protein
MNKIRLLMGAMSLTMVLIVLSIDNEFVKSSKEKRFYPSCNQCVELSAELIDMHNDLQVELNVIMGMSLHNQKSQLTVVSDYCNGDKEAFLQKATKDERADRYEGDKKTKNELKKIKKELEEIVGRLRQCA